MSIVLKQKQYTPAPEGIHAACCVDVVDLGVIEGQFGPKHKCRITWEIVTPMADGRRFSTSKTYTMSLHEKATLFKDLKAWRGRPFTAEELKGFDLEKVLGAPCQLVITHSEVEGKVYANVTAILKADSKNILKPSGQYIRAKDREGYVPPQSGHHEDEEPEAQNLDDLPEVPF
jgi:hypothetical protein